MFIMASFRNYILDFAKNLNKPVFYKTKQMCKVSTKFIHIFSSYHLENNGGKTDRQVDMQLFDEYHIIPHHFMWQVIKIE